MRKESAYTELLPFSIRAVDDAVIGIDFGAASGLDGSKKHNLAIL
jgi:hypothetical protein